MYEYNQSPISLPWCVFWHCVELQLDSSAKPRVRKAVFKLGFCTDIQLNAKFLLSEFLWVKDYTNHWLESPRPNDASQRLC